VTHSCGPCVLAVTLGLLEGFATGHIHDSVVPCLSPELQLDHHSGYPPGDRDRRDMTLLATRFGLDLPSSY
jgi:hypothetical protein